MKLFCVPLVAAFALSAQTASFEVASIKPNHSPDGSNRVRRGVGQITMENVPVRKMTLMAYGIPDDRLYALAGPDWMGSDGYDVLAKYPASADDEQVRAMLRNMLAERFHLALHRETRQLPVYALTVAKGGPKIQPVPAANSRTNGRPGHLEATAITMQKLGDVFGRLMGRPVLDETGMKGVYSFTLDWAPDETTRFSPEAPPAAPSGAPSLFAAFQEQLGLKLEGRKGPVEVLVVDHIERTPTEN